MKADLTPVTHFNLSRYLGKWYEIARIEHRFERNIIKATADYQLNTDGTIKVINAGYNTRLKRMSQVIGKAMTTSQPGLLRVSFFLFFYSDYRVLALEENYAWALVGGGRSTNYLWILSRTPALPPTTLNTILDEAIRRGYDTSRLVFPKQE